MPDPSVQIINLAPNKTAIFLLTYERRKKKHFHKIKLEQETHLHVNKSYDFFIDIKIYSSKSNVFE
jgi:hypothetical protein